MNDDDGRLLFGGPLPQADDSNALAAVSEGALLTSPRGRGPLPHASLLHSHPPESATTAARHKAWLQVFKRLRGEHAYQELSALDSLEKEVQSGGPVLDMQLLMQLTMEKVRIFQEELQAPELALSEQTQQRVVGQVAPVVMAMYRSVEEMIAKDTASMVNISDRVCDIIGQLSQSRRNSAWVGSEEIMEEVSLSKFPELTRDDLMKKSKSDLVQEYMSRDRARTEILDEQRWQLERYEQTIEDMQKKFVDLKDELRHQKEETRKMRAELNNPLDNLSAEMRAGDPVHPRRPNPTRTETQASETSQLSEDPNAFPPQDSSPIMGKQEHLSQFREEGNAATPSEALEASKRHDTLKQLHQLLFKADTESELTRQYARRNAGLGSSVPPSTRSPLTITSPSSSRNTPFRTNTADTAAQMPGLRQHMLLDELDSDDLASPPQTGSGRKLSSSLGLPTHGNATLPQQWQQDPGEHYGFYEDHELPDYEIGRPTPSTLSLNILARFVERSRLAPSKISDLARLVQMGKANEESTSVRQSLDRLDATARDMQLGKPTALTEDQLERGSSQVVLDWIFEAEPYLDGFIELVDRVEDMAVAINLWQHERGDDGSESDVGADPSGNNHVYEDPEWLQDHPTGPCPDCVPVLEFQQELANLIGNSDAAGNNDSKEESRAYASARTSLASRGSGSGSSRRSVTFAEPERQPPQFGRQRRRPSPLDLSRTAPEAVENVAERQSTPHPSTTRSSNGSTSDSASLPPPSQIGKAVSPMLKISEQEDEPAPAVNDTTTEPATQPSSSPETTGLRGRWFAEDRPRVKEYICKNMTGQKQGRSQRPVAKESSPLQKERPTTKEQSHETQQPAENRQPEGERPSREEGRSVARKQSVGDTEQYTESKQPYVGGESRKKQEDTNKRPASNVTHVKDRESDNAEQKDDQMQARDRKLEPHLAPALWRQFLVLVYALIRWLTWGQLVNLCTVLAFIPSLMKYCWDSIQRELASGVLTPDLRRRSLRPLQSPKIPGVALSSLCLWLLLAWNTAMLVSMKEERRLWLAANPRTASYLRGLSSRHPYSWWSPFEVDYALLEPAWDGLSVWLHEVYFRGGLRGLVEAFYQGHVPLVMKSAVSYLAQRSKVALMQAGIEQRQDVLRLM